MPRKNIAGSQWPRMDAGAEAGAIDSTVGSGRENSGQDRWRFRGINAFFQVDHVEDPRGSGCAFRGSLQPAWLLVRIRSDCSCFCRKNRRRFASTRGRSIGFLHTDVATSLRSDAAENGLEPRIALVAAMAFFSISLTLNLMGVKLTRLRAADLEPQSMRRAVTRQYAQANAHVVHYYENLRIVYEVESRVHQLRQAADSAPVSEKTGYSQGKQGASHGQVNQEDRNNQSSQDGLHRERMEVTPVTDQDAQGNRSAPAEPKPIFSGPVVDAYFNAKPLMPSPNVLENVQPKFLSTVFFAFLSRPASQASPCLPQFVRFSVQERKSA